MKQTFAASVWKEHGWYIAQAVEVDVASQGATPDGALANLRDALELYFEPPTLAVTPELHRIEVEVPAR